MVDDVEEALGCHGLPDLFGEFFAGFVPFFIFGQVDLAEVDEVDVFLGRLDGNEVVHFWERC